MSRDLSSSESLLVVGKVVGKAAAGRAAAGRAVGKVVGMVVVGKAAVEFELDNLEQLEQELGVFPDRNDRKRKGPSYNN